MSEAIQFLANIGAVQAGDDEIRLALAVLDTDKDRAAAVEMIGRRNRILHVSAYQQKPGYDWDQLLVEFRCSIAQLKAAVVISPKKPPMIKFDIPASDGLHALRLVGYDDQVIRFEVSDEGDQPKKEKKPKKEKESKGPYGQFWKHLHLAGFVNCPGVTEIVDKAYCGPSETRWDALRAMFGVESLAAVSPEEVYEMFPPDQFPEAKVMVEQAKKKAGVEENS